MSTEHTPGPWAWETLGTNLMLMTPNRGKLIIMTTTGRKTKFQFARRTDNLGGILYDATSENINTFPDARLIAAAPELLEVLKAAMPLIHSITSTDMAPEFRKLEGMIRAVLAKVEGGA